MDDIDSDGLYFQGSPDSLFGNGCGDGTNHGYGDLAGSGGVVEENGMFDSDLCGDGVGVAMPIWALTWTPMNDWVCWNVSTGWSK